MALNKVKQKGENHEMYISCAMEEADSPNHFYIKYGFVDTGLKEDDEQILIKSCKTRIF